MSNPSYTVIELDRPRTLRYTLKSILLLEEKSGKSFGEFISEVQHATTTLSITDALNATIWLLWAGLIHEEPALTFDQVVDLIDQSNITLAEVVETITKAFTEQIMKKVGEVPFRKNQSQSKNLTAGKKFSRQGSGPG